MLLKVLQQVFLRVTVGKLYKSFWIRILVLKILHVQAICFRCAPVTAVTPTTAGIAALEAAHAPPLRAAPLRTSSLPQPEPEPEPEPASPREPRLQRALEPVRRGEQQVHAAPPPAAAPPARARRAQVVQHHNGQTPVVQRLANGRNTSNRSERWLRVATAFSTRLCSFAAFAAGGLGPQA